MKDMNIEDFDTYKYTVKDLCDIFEINPNSFPSIAKKLNLNIYSKMYENDFRALKRYYDENAFNILHDYLKEKSKEKNNWKKAMFIQYEDKIDKLNKEKQELEYKLKVSKAKINNQTEEIEKLKNYTIILEKKFEEEKQKLLNENLNLSHQINEYKNIINELENRSIKDFLRRKK